MLDASQIEFYQQNGYLIIEDYADEKTIAELQAAADTIIDEFDMSTIRIFTTDEQNRHSDHYFLESGDKIRCFFEEAAFNDKGDLVVDKRLAINKIGHAMHDLMPVFERFSYREQLLNIAEQLGQQEPSIAQSQYIFKQPEIGGKVNSHTDSTFIYTDPLSCIGAWVALEDAGMENGCLCAIPGSHTSPLQQQFVRNEEGTGTVFVTTNEERIEWDDQKLVPLEVKKGALVLLHGAVVHASYANHSRKSRHAYIVHLIDLKSKWSPRNWLQRPPEMPFRSMKSVVRSTGDKK